MSLNTTVSHPAQFKRIPNTDGGQPSAHQNSLVNLSAAVLAVDDVIVIGPRMNKMSRIVDIGVWMPTISNNVARCKFALVAADDVDNEKSTIAILHSAVANMGSSASDGNVGFIEAKDILDTDSLDSTNDELYHEFRTLRGYKFSEAVYPALICTNAGTAATISTERDRYVTYSDFIVGA